jgi:hypothetical protein
MRNELSPALKRDLVTAAERIAGAVSSKRNQASQLRNLIQVTQVESEVPVLVNFIHYQAGRRATRDFWQGIEMPVVRFLEEDIGKNPDLQEPEMRRKAIQHFFGYMVRHYVYVSQGGRR